jgi:hypothetical protein
MGGCQVERRIKRDTQVVLKVHFLPVLEFSKELALQV